MTRIAVDITDKGRRSIIDQVKSLTGRSHLPTEDGAIWEDSCRRPIVEALLAKAQPGCGFVQAEIGSLDTRSRHPEFVTLDESEIVWEDAGEDAP